ncbi:MAG: hypothetical protein QOD42_1569 [Sphingomonadales bacterium]|jgi:hypothetical protein|nr:hypothetical protein [Sphingomonadales bacterium]
MTERVPLLILLFACALFGVAWWTQARASEAAAPRNAPGAATHAPPVPSPTRKLDEYGDIPFEDEKARLDNFAIEVQNNPMGQGYLICYGGRVGRAGEAMRRCRRARNYVSGHRRIEASRIVMVDGGYREDLTVELWVVPSGVTPPQATPSVDPREVRFIKGKVKRRARRR